MEFYMKTHTFGQTTEGGTPLGGFQHLFPAFTLQLSHVRNIVELAYLCCDFYFQAFELKKWTELKCTCKSARYFTKNSTVFQCHASI